MGVFLRRLAKKDKPQNQRQTQSCPVFSSLLQNFSDEQKYRILDLGEASGANVAFFSGLRCKLFMGDVAPALLSYQTSLSDDEQPRLLLQDMLGLDDLSDLNLVMCWDILNYLDTRLIEHFAICLYQIMAKGGCLHTFIFTHKAMPTGPGNYHILDANQMNAVHPIGDKISAPCYGQRELERLMPGFTVKQTRLLQIGVQEYLFNRD